MSRNSGTPLDGVLLVDKPAGPSSQGVVTAVRKALGAEKAGHTGTLDPFATGLLVVCLGRATKLAGYLTGEDKEYEATVALGVATDTDDSTGRELARADASRVTRAAVEEALAVFRGTIAQVPPDYSAIQRDGKRMYDLARKGEAVRLEPRQVVVHSLDLRSFEPATGTEGPAAMARAHLRLRVSKGTYIRAIARDLGRALGVGGHLTVLRRTASGGLRADEALPLDRVREAPDEARTRILPLEAVPLPMPDLRVDEEEAARLAHGVPPRQSAKDAPGPPGSRRIVAPDGRVLAVATLSEGGQLRLDRVI